MNDAKLIALGERFEEIQKKLRPVEAEHSRLHEETQDYAYSKTGFDPGDIDNSVDGIAAERYLAACEEMGERNGFRVCDEKLMVLDREQTAVMREVMYTPATSNAGLRVKILVAIRANDHLWDKLFGELDWDKRAIRSLIEAACVIVNITAPTDMQDSILDYDKEAHISPGSAALN